MKKKLWISMRKCDKKRPNKGKEKLRPAKKKLKQILNQQEELQQINTLVERNIRF